MTVCLACKFHINNVQRAWEADCQSSTALSCSVTRIPLLPSGSRWTTAGSVEPPVHHHTGGKPEKSRRGKSLANRSDDRPLHVCVLCVCVCCVRACVMCVCRCVCMCIRTRVYVLQCVQPTHGSNYTKNSTIYNEQWPLTWCNSKPKQHGTTHVSDASHTLSRASGSTSTVPLYQGRKARDAVCSALL